MIQLNIKLLLLNIIFFFSLFNIFAEIDRDNIMNVSPLSLFGNDLTPDSEQIDSIQNFGDGELKINNQEISALLKLNYGNVIGKDSAKIIVFYFFDYNNDNCRKIDSFVQNLVVENSDIKIFLVDASLNKNKIGNYISRSVLSSSLQGKYLDAHDALMKSTHALLHDVQIDDLLKDSMINIKRVKDALFLEKISNILNNNEEIIKKCGIKSVPYFIICYSSAPYSQISFLDESGSSDLVKKKLYEFFQK